MFDDILSAVKQELGNHPEITSLPPEQQEAIHNEIANHVNNTIQNQSIPSQSGGGGLLSNLEGMLTSGSPLTGAIEGGLVSSLGSKFGLSPGITGAIAGALPGLIQKFANKNS
ncbi:MAG TPA: hypothetical protein VET23_13975 [Chitinophagaceae bacterium]|nr:hypothetical protein [Chitinophagaceae bacterium]